MSDRPAALVADGLVRRYGDRLVVDHASLTIEPGETVSLMGASGCGKTTLLHMLGTLDRPDEGRLELGGRDVSHLSESERTGLLARGWGSCSSRATSCPS